MLPQRGNLSSEEVRPDRKAVHSEANGVEQRQGQRKGLAHHYPEKQRLREQGEAGFCSTEWPGQGRAGHCLEGEWAVFLFPQGSLLLAVPLCLLGLSGVLTSVLLRHPIPPYCWVQRPSLDVDVSDLHVFLSISDSELGTALSPWSGSVLSFWADSICWNSDRYVLAGLLGCGLRAALSLHNQSWWP